MSLIVPGVWLGSFEESFCAPDGVTHILNVAEECDVAERVGRTYLKLGARDDDPTEDISRILPAALNFIDNALRGGEVFVHCLEGVSRSACVVIAWLCACRGMTFDDATRLVHSARPLIDPFPAYAVQIRSSVTSHDLVKAGYRADFTRQQPNTPAS